MKSPVMAGDAWKIPGAGHAGNPPVKTVQEVNTVVVCGALVFPTSVLPGNAMAAGATNEVALASAGDRAMRPAAKVASPAKWVLRRIDASPV
jgi:hypothetical protein